MSDLRVKLDLSRLTAGSSSKTWLLIKSGTCDTIRDVKETICRRFCLEQSADQFHVSLQDAIVQEDETASILNSDDLLVLRENKCASKSNSSSNPAVGNRNEIADSPRQVPSHPTLLFESAQLSNNLDEVEVSRVQTRRRKRKRKHPEPDVGIPPTRAEDELETAQTCAAIENLAESKKPKKKRKKRTPSDENVDDEASESCLSEKIAVSVGPKINNGAEGRKKQPPSEENAVDETSGSHLSEELNGPSGPKINGGAEKRKKQLPSDENADDEASGSRLSEEIKESGKKTNSEAESMPSDAEPDRQKSSPKKKRRKRRKRKTRESMDEEHRVTATSLGRMPAPAISLGRRPAAPKFSNVAGDPSRHLRFESPGPEDVDHECDHDISLDRSKDSNTRNLVAEKPTPQSDRICTVDSAVGEAPKLNGAQIPKPTLNRDFNQCPPLVGPPRIGDTIAYKVLELSESYTPEISDFKVGKVVSFDAESSQINVEFLQPLSVKVKRGKFEILSDEELDRCEDDEWNGFEVEPPPDKFETVTNDHLCYSAMMDVKLVVE